MNGKKALQHIYGLVYVAVFAALIAVGAFIKIPTPLVPVTLQMAFCMLAALLAGWKIATAAVVIYITVGLCGLPVFTAGGGFSYVLNPTFGYMIGFIFGTLFAGIIARGFNNERAPTVKRCLLACLACCATVYIIGVPYTYMILTAYLGRAVTAGYVVLSGWVMFIPTDAIWCGLASTAAVKLLPAMGKAGVKLADGAEAIG